MLTTTVSLYYQNIGGLSPESWSTNLTFAGLASLLGVITVGFIMDKIGRILSLIYCSVGSAIGIAGIAFLINPIFLILTYFFMASFGLFLLVYISEMFSTKIRATSLGLSVSISRIGYILGPLIGTIFLPAVVSQETIWEFKIYYILASLIILLPLLSLIWNKYDAKGKSLEKIQEELKSRDSTPTEQMTTD